MALSDALIPIAPGSLQLRDEARGESQDVHVAAFRMAPTPVVTALWDAVHAREAPADTAALPAVDVSWNDAVRFCNTLSRIAGFTPCYILPEDGSAHGAALQPARDMRREMKGGRISTAAVRNDAALTSTTRASHIDRAQRDTRALDEVVWDVAADGFRLPTEAEWEFACRAASTDVRYGPLEDIAWFADNAEDRRHPVAMKAPNAWGLYDTIGNVWEWCWDLYGPTYGRYRVFRGGGFSDPPRGCRASCRRKSHPRFAIDDLGFRVVRGSVG